MALFIRQDDSRTELQRRLAAELQEKAKKKAADEAQPLPDGVEDSRYVKEYQSSSRLFAFWIIVAVLIVCIFIGYVILAS